ncbi:Histone-lysine N-methyltransferase 2D [Goodea atripinnis]|uniref:Histone-lysine N-methyltransferase 2D n=1 Tax=Goodea atripinnis TaxID=208336 RepID=A0ABV0MEG6_9TELE
MDEQKSNCEENDSEPTENAFVPVPFVIVWSGACWDSGNCDTSGPGGCWLHHWCAVWSDGVKQTEDKELENVDKAVISGTQRHCEYCKRLGATIQCHVEGCSRFYHFPCSAASGSFQSMKQLVLLCPEHIDKAEELGKRTMGTFAIIVMPL